MLCEFPINAAEYENSFLAGKNIGYKYITARRTYSWVMI